MNRWFMILVFGIIACGDMEKDDDAVVTLVPTNVQNIFTAECAKSGCHAGSAPQANQNLSENVAYANIVNVNSVEVPAKKRIAPGDTTNSYLFDKIKGIQTVGDRMPADGPPYLTEAEIDTIRTWILNGAPPRP